MISVYIAHVFVFIASIAIIFTLEDFVDLGSEVLCVYQSLYFKCFFTCSFRLKSKCFHCVVAASTTADSSFGQQVPLHSTKDYHEIYSA